MNKDEMNTLEERAKSFFGQVNPAHDWFHVKRVEEVALELAEKENADRDVVKASVLLHDIGRGKEDRGYIDNHAAWGAEKSREIMEELGLKEDFIEEVVHCVESHRYSKDPDPQSLEAKVVSDADNLDALGATGIARTFTYGGERDKVIADPELPAESDDSKSGETSLNHIEKKILSLKARMYTESGREMAEERHSYVEEFVERFKLEMNGEK